MTDPQGVASVNLAYQLVEPGNYIPVEDPAYNTPANWTTVAMHDDGLNGDLVASDGIYSYVMPASIQTNRRLVRYRISSTDGLGKSVTAPYADDPSAELRVLRLRRRAQLVRRCPARRGRGERAGRHVRCGGAELDGGLPR